MSGTVSRRLAGISSITIDGSTYDLVGDLTWSPSTVKRETLVGLDGVHGFGELPISGHIACTIRDNGGIRLSDFNAMTNVTVQIALANGKSIIGSNMWTVESQESKAENATFEVRFEGLYVDEVAV